jgi:hypothetical protein
MALGCGVTSVRGNRGENYENEPLVRQKHIKKKNILPYSKELGHSKAVAAKQFSTPCLGLISKDQLNKYCADGKPSLNPNSHRVGHIGPTLFKANYLEKY